MFDKFLNDIVTIIKANGERYENIKAQVGSNEIFIHDTNLPIKDGDIILRELPNKTIERFKIIEVVFNREFQSIPANFELKVKKESSSLKDPVPRNVTNVTYNMHGKYSKINIGSEDSSIIISNKNAPIIITELRETIKNRIQPDLEREKLLAKLDEIELTLRGNDKSEYLEKYKEFIALAANHITIIAPFLPALAELL